jgi:hypothetical protein
MTFNAKVGSKTFDYKQIIDATHPAIVLGMDVAASQGVIAKGQIVAKNSSGKIIPYAKYEYIAGPPVVDNRQTIGTGNASTTTFTGTLTDHPCCPGSIVVTAATITGLDDGCGNIKGSGISGYIKYKTGYISVTFTSAPGNGVVIQAAYANRPVGVITNVIDTSYETTGSIVVHGTVVKANLLVKAGASIEAATSTDAARLEPPIIAI